MSGTEGGTSCRGIANNAESSGGEEAEPVVTGEAGACADVDVYLALLRHTMLLPLTFGDLEIEALIDTGATASLITEQWCSQVKGLPGAIYRPPQSLAGFGSTRVACARAINLAFSCGCLSFTESFMVVPTEAIRHSVILGTTFLQHYRAVLDIPSRKLVASGSFGVWECYLPLADEPIADVLHDIPVTCAEDIVIQSGEACLVQVVVDAQALRGDQGLKLYFE